MNNTKILMPFIPGITINVTDRCNFKCKYCPPYGENLCKGLCEYDSDNIIYIINLAKKHGVQQIRFTGGEPFLEPNRLMRFLDACDDSFKRIVVNTNGSLIRQNIEWLDRFKTKIVLKFSLDTINKEKFNTVTQTNEFDVVYKNIILTKRRNYNVEINTVLFNQSFREVCDLIDFSCKNRINTKLLTISSFYGFVNKGKPSFDIERLTAYLEGLSSQFTSEKLVGERGTDMLVYLINDTKIIIFDSATTDSLTPNKAYFPYCEAYCNQYPCDHGAFSISISTDGIMSICRAKKELGENIFFCSKEHVNNSFISQLKQFKNCFSINLNQIRRIKNV